MWNRSGASQMFLGTTENAEDAEGCHDTGCFRVFGAFCGSKWDRPAVWELG